MAGTIACPNCNFENLAGSRFCGNCAQDLIKPCPACGEENLLAAKFCSYCKADFTAWSNTLPGLRLDRARLWAEQFEKMGWLDDPRKMTNGKEDKRKGGPGEQIQNLHKEGKLPEPEDAFEPWIFACYAFPVGNKVGRPHTIAYAPPKTYLKKPLAAKMALGLAQSIPYMIATRCRFVFIATYAPELTLVIPYTNIESYQWTAKGDVIMNTDSGNVEFKIHLQGPGFLNVAVALAASDPVSRYRGVDEIRERTDQNRSYMDVIGMFLKEVYDSSHKK